MITKTALLPVPGNWNTGKSIRKAGMMGTQQKGLLNFTQCWEPHPPGPDQTEWSGVSRSGSGWQQTPVPRRCKEWRVLKLDWKRRTWRWFGEKPMSKIPSVAMLGYFYKPMISFESVNDMGRGTTGPISFRLGLLPLLPHPFIGPFLPIEF